MIQFNIPPFVGKEQEYIKQAIESNQKLCGDGQFTKKCNLWFEEKFNTTKSLLTTSCTHAIEMAAILIDIKPGDEVIAPSFTFVSTVNAFVLRGAKMVFVDIRPDTLNIDENLIESAITEKTRAIVPVHYAGVSCEMDKIMDIAKKYNIYVIEDAAQGVMSTYKGQALGTIGDFGCYSFHETKNYTMGEGGAILIQNNGFIERSEIIREKGTNRSKFFRGQVDKYSWVDIGSSYLPSELNAAYLYAQLEEADKINRNRLNTWNMYYDKLSKLKENGMIELPYIPDYCEHNAHMFYIKCKDLAERTELISYLKKNDIIAVFHYIPLHSSEAGIKYGRFYGEDNYTTKESERLVRLPLYYGLENIKVQYVVDKIYEFYNIFSLE
jgi:dTDP-4-amino-4,6-dideoxygalactose transaminase